MASPFPSNLDWPTNYGASRLTGKFMDLQGQPIRGRLVITANVISVADIANSLTIIATPRTVLLDNSGSFDIFLPATNDPDVNPSGWNYKVVEQWDGGGGRTYNIDAPEGVTQDISAVAPVPASTGTPITRGASAYDVAVANGYVGTQAQWLASLQGTGGTGGGALTNGSVLDVHVASNAAIQLSKTADSATRVAMTATERTKLSGIATGATANSTDTALRDRSTHSGTQLSGTISDFTEAAQDATAALLVAGANITLAYNDAANTLTITSAGAGGGTATTTSAGITDFTEAAQDAAASMLVAGTGISLSYNDAANTLTITSTASGAFSSATDPVFVEGVQDVIGSSIVAGNGISVAYNDTANTFTITGSSTGTLVLGPTDPVPPGTPAGTIIYRTA